MKLMVINGPNLNLLGIREESIYGKKDYNALEERIKKEALDLNCKVDVFQSNMEGEIIDLIHKAYFENYDGIIMNPGAYTHYSYAIYDAIKSVDIDVIEVHISNIHAREEFRRKSVTAAACIGQISGFGIEGYLMAIKHLYSKK